METPEMRGGENWGFKSIHAHPLHALAAFSRGTHGFFLMNGFQLCVICTPRLSGIWASGSLRKLEETQDQSLPSGCS